jgi:hypothetical protein
VGGLKLQLKSSRHLVRLINHTTENFVNAMEDSNSTMSTEDTDDDDPQTSTVSSEKPHACTYPGCKSSFGRPSRLVTHIRVHTGEVSKENVQYNEVKLNSYNFMACIVETLQV